MRDFDAEYIATLCIGLPDTSRVKRGGAVDFDRAIQAAILDTLRLIYWQGTRDGQKGRHKPESVLDSLINPKKKDKIVSFNSGEDFDLYRKRLIEGLQ